MYIRKVELKNIRGVGEEVLVVDFTRFAPGQGFNGFTVIAGPSGSGKTTLLQAIAASCVAGAGSAWLLSPGAMLEWVHISAETPHLDDEGTTCVWLKATKEDGPHHSEWVEDKFYLRVDWRRNGSHVQKIDPFLKDATYTNYFWYASSYGMKTNGWFLAGYGPNRSIERSSPDAQRLLKASPRTASLVTLFRSDAALDAAVPWLIQQESLSMQLKYEKIKTMVDGIKRFLGDGLLGPGTQVIYIKENDIWIEYEHGFKQSLSRVAFAQASVFRMVLDIILRIEQFKPGYLVKEITSWSNRSYKLSINYAGVVMIDEIELHMHVKLQGYIIEWLKSHFPKMQFIVTTTSLAVCDYADHGHLFGLPKVGEVRSYQDTNSLKELL